MRWSRAGASEPWWVQAQSWPHLPGLVSPGVAWVCYSITCVFARRTSLFTYSSSINSSKDVCTLFLRFLSTIISVFCDNFAQFELFPIFVLLISTHRLFRLLSFSYVFRVFADF